MDFHIAKYLPPFPHCSLLGYSPRAPSINTHRPTPENIYIIFFFSFLKDGVKSCFCFCFSF